MPDDGGRDTALPAEAGGDVQVGQTYCNVERPRRVWRVTARYGDLCRLERIDSPNVVRYPALKAMRDSTRYVRRY
jgi:hypothetical protein